MIVLIGKGQKTKNRKLIRMEIDYDFEQEEANKIRSVNVNGSADDRYGCNGIILRATA